jgi:membrane-bound ClpP family serine protease
VADFQGRGVVHLHGERWQADSRVALHRGQQVTVTGMRVLILDVEPANPSEESLP